MQKTSNYLFSADLIRAIAIIFVVLIHVFSEFLNYPKVLGSADWWIADSINACARVSVPLFIMLSGMLILHSEKEYTIKEFLRKRLGKIGIPLVIWPLIYFLWNILLKPVPFSFSSVMRDYINLNIYYHLYYIYIMAALYLLTPVLKIITRHGTQEIKKYFFILTALFSFLLTASIYFFHIDINLSTIFTVFIPYLCYYLAGDYFRHTKLTKKQFYICSTLFIAAAILAVLGTRLHMSYVRNTSLGKNLIDYGKYFYDYTSITVGLMSVIAFISLHNVTHKFPRLHENKIAPLIVSLAGASFGIYLIHPLLLEFSNKILKIPFEALPVPLSIFLFIKLFGIVLVSYLIVIVIKKIPLLKFLV